MTAHRPKPTLTPERIDWFARYYSQNQAWGVFHVTLDDGNYEIGASETAHRPGTDVCNWDLPRAEWPADLRDAAEWFDKLTPSQRRRLGKKAEQRASELGLVRRPSKLRWSVVVTKVDAARGIITVDWKP